MSNYNTAEYRAFELGCAAGRRGQPAEEFNCCICGSTVFEGQPTEIGLTIQVCRDSVCVDKRLRQLLEAEIALAKFKREMRATLLMIALKAEHEAHGLEDAA
jgi:hypothetical protein